mmetsp:Transcript_15204/g.18329  ORF Transcript_15204/g.18329 Transcript_15204/m.18329 type:complete len:223 (-) Transcript_15204:122-790(-)|eukprot:CAMPEP_0197843762 /NCGR_PEP_ID=MMETSP1438-20131217/701_1 /TAXON_ID=1461541 /ORGANISM="Pterosperma sp., Strain CCMP1384" /LENGTH=222 /DNA_ID=CAMNT_0043454129 /DNA_START=68 /DNA_END=736 /DNA_ORIENTATION=-
MASVASVSTPVFVAKQQNVQLASKPVGCQLGLPARKTRSVALNNSRKQSVVLASSDSKIADASKAVASFVLPLVMLGSPAMADYNIMSDLKGATTATAAEASAPAPAPADDPAAKAARIAAAKALKAEITGDLSKGDLGRGGTLDTSNKGPKAFAAGSKSSSAAAPAEKAAAPAPKKEKKKAGEVLTQPLLLAMLGLFSPLLVMTAFSFQTGARLLGQLGDE